MNLTNEQLQAINEIDNNLQIIACAGSGKTEVISRRIANILKSKPDIKPENIVAFTFTEKASISLKNRIAKASDGIDISNMYVGTIHSFCFKVLQENCPEYSEFKILNTVKNYHFINRYYSKCGMEDAELHCNSRNIKLFLNCIDKLIYDYDNRTLWSEKDKRILNNYKECLYSKKYFDFSLLIHETLKVLKNKNEILKNIKYLIVDEYQDVDNLQEQLIEIFNKNNCNICVVGDDDQTIYRFRGSNAKNMINFAKKYPNVTQIKLGKNFRCVNTIVDIADTVIKNNKDRLEKNMISNSKGNVVNALGFEEREEQYYHIARKIKHLHNIGTDYKDIAILVRKGKYINDIVKVLDSYSIPYVSDSAEYFFNNKYFKLFVKTFDIIPNLSKSELYNLWQNYSVREKFNIGFRYLRNAVGNSKYVSLSEILQNYVEMIGFFDDCDDLDIRQDVLNGMLEILNDFEEIYLEYQLSAKIKRIIDFLNTSAAEQYKYHNFKSNDSDDDGIQIMTVHKSKGLEFDAVFLPNLDNREFPAGNVGGKKYWHILSERFEENKDKFEGSIDDERKLFYVAVTRAKNYLCLTYSKSNPSIFLKEASNSVYLNIDKSDLIKVTEVRKYSADSISNNNNNKEYWNLVKKAKRALYDYYFTFVGGYKAALGDIERIKGMSPDEILEEASKLHLI